MTVRLSPLLCLGTALLLGCENDSPEETANCLCLAEPDAANTDDPDAALAADAQVAQDGSAGEDAGADAQAADDAGSLPEVDANFMPSASPVGNAYAETSFELLKPAALQPLLTQASTLIGAGRLFVNAYRAAGQAAVIDYGAADALSSAEVQWQFPEDERFSIWTMPVAEAPTTYRSEPFTYRLLARVQILIATSYVAMDVRDTLYEAAFDSDFLRIETGTLKGALTRSEAESSPLEVGPLCTQYCPEAWCGSHTLRTLSDLLDCHDAVMDIDRNEDGTLDAYALELAFSSERVLVAPHPDDAP